MSFWKIGKEEANKGFGARNPNNFPSSQAREQHQAGRNAELQRQQQRQQEQLRNSNGKK